MKRMWELKQAATAGTLDLYIYGDVEGDYYSWWDGLVKSETSAKNFRDELAKHGDVNQINLYINSYGGSVFEGTAIYSQLMRHPAKKTAYIDGFACSIASVIAMACDEIVMPKNTMMMIHNMWMGVYGNAAELRKAAEDLDTINAAGRQAYLTKAGEKLSEEKLVQMMDAETWLTAAECVEYGLADRFAEEDADMSAANEMLQKANTTINQKINLQKNLAAQLRELSKKEEKPAEKKEPKKTEEKPANSIMAMLGGYFNA